MRRHFEEIEEELKARLLHMGSLVEEMIHLAAKALTQRKEEPLKKVQENEELVNALHIEIDDRCLKLLALHQPAAQDLRFIIACVKINADLERVGDQAVNISQNTQVLLGQPQLGAKLLDIPRMVELASRMLRDSLDAFVKNNVDLARAVLDKDAQEDALKTQAFHELTKIMQSDSSTIKGAMGLILIARNLERVADHATNIAEDIIFMVLGKDIRHHAEEKT